MNSILNKEKPVKESSDDPPEYGTATNSLLPIEELTTKQNGLFIISGAAGTGKSAVSSCLYKKIKENPDVWIIRIQLADHQKALKELAIDNSTGTDQARSVLFNFIAKLSGVVGQSSFARSLLKHRLEAGDRIVLMLDGFGKRQPMPR